MFSMLIEQEKNQNVVKYVEQSWKKTFISNFIN